MGGTARLVQRRRNAGLRELVGDSKEGRGSMRCDGKSAQGAESGLDVGLRRRGPIVGRSRSVDVERRWLAVDSARDAAVARERNRTRSWDRDEERPISNRRETSKVESVSGGLEAGQRARVRGGAAGWTGATTSRRQAAAADPTAAFGGEGKARQGKVAVERRM